METHTKGLQIGIVSRQTGLSIDTIRFYERMGMLQAPRRSASGYRLFTDADVLTLAFVSRAHAMGFTLKEVRDLLQLRKADGACSSVKQLLRTRIQLIRKRMAELKFLEQELAAALRKCSRVKSHTGDDCDCPVISDIHFALSPADRSNGARPSNRK